MPGSPGAAWIAIKLRRGRRARMTPEQLAEDDRQDAVWIAKFERESLIALGAITLIILAAVGVALVR
jgi:hypothetical protein